MGMKTGSRNELEVKIAAPAHRVTGSQARTGKPVGSERPVLARAGMMRVARLTMQWF
jgi:hypothetical protein